MDIGSIAQVIGSLGFPIVACVALYYSNEKESERHDAEMAKITEALNNNTLAISQLADKLSHIMGG